MEKDQCCHLEPGPVDMRHIACLDILVEDIPQYKGDGKEHSGLSYSEDQGNAKDVILLPEIPEIEPPRLAVPDATDFPVNALESFYWAHFDGAKIGKQNWWSQDEINSTICSRSDEGKIPFHPKKSETLTGICIACEINRKGAYLGCDERKSRQDENPLREAVLRVGAVCDCMYRSQEFGIRG
jgi:hypothetical protein